MKTYTKGGRAWRSVLLAGSAGALLLTSAALAQDAMAQGIQPQQGMANTFIVGTLQGTIMSVDLNRATVTLNTGGNLGLTGSGGSSSASGGGQTVTLQARPFDLANFNPGDVVALTYNNYNGVLWLAPQGGAQAAPGQQQAWSQYGRITGPVTGVDRQRGLIAVRGQIFRAHPQQTQGVFPGQFVSLSFAQVGQQPWIDQVQASPLAGQQGGLQGQQQGMQQQPQQQQQLQQQPQQQGAMQQPQQQQLQPQGAAGQTGGAADSDVEEHIEKDVDIEKD